MNALSYEQRKAALIEEINCAFDGVELGEGVSFHESFIVDDYRIDDRNHELRREARAKDTDTRWQDVPEELIAHWGNAVLNFVDVQGFRYYLPALLVWYLRHMDSEDVDFSSNTFQHIDYQLEGGFEDHVSDSNLTKFSSLSLVQSQAVAHFLEFNVAREDKLEAEDEAERQVELARGEMTEEQARSWREASKVSREAHDYTGRALKRYWEHFSSAAP